MKKGKASWLKHLDFLIIDVFCLLLAYTLVSFLRYGNTFFAMENYRRMSVIIAIASVFSGLIFESYHDVLRRGYYREFRAIFQHICITVATVLGYIFFAKIHAQYSRATYIGTFAIGGLLMYIVHLLWKRIVRNGIKKNSAKDRVIVVVSNEDADSFIGELMERDYAEYQIVGCILYNDDVRTKVQGIPIACKLDDFKEYVRDNVIDAVLIRPDRVNNNLRKTINGFVEMGITVYIELTKTYGSFPDMHGGSFGEYKVLTISVHTARFRQLFVKRLADIVGSLIGLIFAGFAFIVFASIIKKQSNGSIFFSQIRIGKNGRQFKLYKFRSMYVDAEMRKKELQDSNKMRGQMFKIDDDPRITPIGRFIRKYSIDELPQFWNVLRGDMSLVGTRPPTIDEVEQYEAHHRIRLSIKPGMTGLWQVSGRNNITNFEEVVELDKKYIHEWNLGLDIKILGQTILAVFGGKGSA